MPTTAYFNKTGYITNDTDFRALGLAIGQALDSIGFTKTADSGQIDWGTVSKPTSSSTYAGYEIRSFPAGSLQTANPIVMKIEYGTGGGSAYFSIRLSIGHATDGAGGFVGAASTAYQVPTNGYNAAACHCFVSGDSNRLSMLLFAGTTGSSPYFICVSIDRLRDDLANPTDTGVNVVLFGSSSSSYTYQFMLPKTGAQFPSTALPQPMCIYSPGGGSSGIPGAWGLGMFISYVYPYLGCAWNPDLNVIVYPADVIQQAGGTIMAIRQYDGQDHNYVMCGAYNSSANLNGNTNANYSLGVRYE